MKKLILSLVFLLVGMAAWAQHGSCGNHSNYNNNQPSSNATPGTSTIAKITKVDYVVYPNPANQYFQLNEEAVTKGFAREIRIFSSTGQEVASFAIAKGEVYDVSALPSGIFVVRLLDYKNEVVESLMLFKTDAAIQN
ncbi:MAG TPA: T9SS type A sorting domain-containing protein [Saprospiraceae bacterium]|nr:T9SS type A sorting domain-containing protein [Saprospiraceae bacterium]HMQ82942.1 T9SS type A sorting domain-containing protein [Saprospiraceae bacterium]